MSVIFEPVHDDLEAYVLGALDSGDEQRFVAHLAECSECRAGAASYVPVMHALQAVPSAMPPAFPQFAPVAVPRRFSLPLFAYAAAAAFLLALGGGINFLMQPRTDNMLVQVAGMMADGPRQVALTGPGVRGRIIVGRRGHRTAVVLRGLPAAPAGEVYHVWVQGAQMKLIGALVPARDGMHVLLVDGNQLAGTQRVAVDLERMDTALAPAGPTVASGSVQ